MPTAGTSTPTSAEHTPISEFAPPSASVGTFRPIYSVGTHDSQAFSARYSVGFYPPGPKFALVADAVCASQVVSYGGTAKITKLVIATNYVPTSLVYYAAQYG